LVSPCFTRLYILNNTFSIEPSLDQSVWLKLAPEPCRSLTFRLAPTHTIKKAFAMISKILAEVGSNTSKFHDVSYWILLKKWCRKASHSTMGQKRRSDFYIFGDKALMFQTGREHYISYVNRFVLLTGPKHIISGHFYLTLGFLE
jgi:hypothetical protein